MTVARSRARLTALLLGVLLAGGAPAADNPVSQEAPDLSAARAKIAANDYPGAIADLTRLLDRYQHADLYNLLGYSYRKSADLRNAATYYAKALEFDPRHKGALEYQGEMFVQLGQIDKAKANLARLIALCPQGCEERADLEQAIAKAAAAKAN